MRGRGSFHLGREAVCPLADLLCTGGSVARDLARDGCLVDHNILVIRPGPRRLPRGSFLRCRAGCVVVPDNALSARGYLRLDMRLDMRLGMRLGMRLDMCSGEGDRRTRV